MGRNERHKMRAAGRVTELLLDGKKTVLAGGLILVMAFMWIRVLFGHKPAPAAAAPEQKPAATTAREGHPKVRMLEVPKVAGRNDAILRDCFNIQNWTQFRQSAAVQSAGTDTEVPVVPPNRDQEVMQQVAQTLKLEAVSRQDGSQAFVNDQWLKVGDRFTVEHGTDFLEFEVLRISEDAVLVECRSIQLTLKLAQYVDVRK